VVEVDQVVGDSEGVGDAVAELHAFGLLHVCGGHVCPSRAAVRFDQLSQVTI
jgi:hypothetical protein